MIMKKIFSLTKRKLPTTILSVLLISWLLLSVGRTFYNVSKLFTQDKHLFFLTSAQVEREVYGNLYVLKNELLQVTKKKSILILGDDGGLYFFLRYLLYPQKIYWVNNTSFEDESKRPWEFVFIPFGQKKVQGKNIIPVINPQTGEELGTIIKL